MFQQVSTTHVIQLMQVHMGLLQYVLVVSRLVWQWHNDHLDQHYWHDGRVHNGRRMSFQDLLLLSWMSSSIAGLSVFLLILLCIPVCLGALGDFLDNGDG